MLTLLICRVADDRVAAALGKTSVDAAAAAAAASADSVELLCAFGMHDSFQHPVSLSHFSQPKQKNGGVPNSHS